jgi:hypothetical protein
MSLTHQQIDRRSLSFYRMTVYLIDHDPNKRGLIVAKKRLVRWLAASPDSIPYKMWSKIISKPWPEIRKRLLEQSDEMQFLRQSSPFGGNECLPNEIRMRIIRKFSVKARYEKNRRRTRS